MSQPIAVERLGSGPPVLLVHGGVGPELTWERQRALAERWTLLIPTRRGFPRSAPADRQDFERDAEDLSDLLDPPAHLVGFSYGGVGAILATQRHPELVRSLTLIESPLYAGAPDDPRVQALALAGNAFLAGEADPDTEREFLANAGLDLDAVTGPTAALIEEAVIAARGGRPPSEANPDLAAIAESGVPAMIVSGGHHEGIEALCDGLATQLRARRETVKGAGHAVPRAPGFNETLESFLTSVDR